jgi:3-oxoacyl-[acyl-carrier-protein] synthase III
MTGVQGDWIEGRSRVKTRFLSTTPDAARRLAVFAARQALIDAAIAAETITTVIVATTCHGTAAPTVTADSVRRELALHQAQGADVTTFGIAFFQAIALAQALLGEGGAALIVGAEAFSATGALRDRRNCYKYSEGAGAIVVARSGGFARLSPIRSSASVDRLFEGEQGHGTNATNSSAMLINQESDAPLPASLRVAGGRAMESFDPFPGAGWFVAAAAPLLLYRLLSDRRLQAGQCITIWGTDGGRAAASVSLELTRAHQPRAQEGDSIVAVENAAERFCICGGANDLEQQVLAAPPSTEEPWNMMLALGIRAKIGGQPTPRLSALALAEATAIINNHTRQYDRVLRLAEEPKYAVLLRYITEEDAKRLGQRLASLLENVDPAGELEITADFHCLTISPENRPTQARELIAFLTNANLV